MKPNQYNVVITVGSCLNSDTATIFVPNFGDKARPFEFPIGMSPKSIFLIKSDHYCTSMNLPRVNVQTFKDTKLRDSHMKFWKEAVCFGPKVLLTCR